MVKVGVGSISPFVCRFNFSAISDPRMVAYQGSHQVTGWQGITREDGLSESQIMEEGRRWAGDSTQEDNSNARREKETVGRNHHVQCG